MYGIVNIYAAGEIVAFIGGKGRTVQLRLEDRYSGVRKGVPCYSNRDTEMCQREKMTQNKRKL